MDTETAFLATIAADPADAAARLAYADWLQEQGDPRGELVRLEEAARRLPAFADGFWETKPRRDELRVGAPAEWLTTMRYVGPRPLFGHGVPDDWRGRWRLIRAFVECWHGVGPLGDIGGRADAIREAEARLGRTLPPSVREYVALVADTSGGQSPFRDISETANLNGYPAVSLMLISEGEYRWGVRHADLGLADPPVYGFCLDFEQAGSDDGPYALLPDAPNPIADTVSGWLLGHLIAYIPGRSSFSAFVSDNAAAAAQLEAAFPNRGLWGGWVIFESSDLFVLFTPPMYGRDGSVKVETMRKLPREAVPAFLWKLAERRRSWSGIFAPSRTPQDDDIPF